VLLVQFNYAAAAVRKYKPEEIKACAVKRVTDFWSSFDYSTTNKSPDKQRPIPYDAAGN